MKIISLILFFLLPFLNCGASENYSLDLKNKIKESTQKGTTYKKVLELSTPVGRKIELIANSTQILVGKKISGTAKVYKGGNRYSRTVKIQ